MTWFERIMERHKNDPDFIWEGWDLVEDEYPFEPLTCDAFTDAPLSI